MLTFVAFLMLAGHMLLACQPIIALLTWVVQALLCCGTKVTDAPMTCSLYVYYPHTFIIHGTQECKYIQTCCSHAWDTWNTYMHIHVWQVLTGLFKCYVACS